MRKSCMKKIVGTALCIGMVAALAGCGSGSGIGSASEKPSVVQAPMDTETDEVAETTEATETIENTSESVVESETESGPLGSINALTVGTKGWTEDDWITWANDLFATACSLEFDYEAGGCITTDGSSSISVNGMDYYVATDYNSIEEATADYFSVFSKTGRENKFAEYMQEQDGRLYILPAGRGSDIFYKESRVTSISNIGENTIEFTVENYYYEDLFDDPAEQENHITMTTDTFTVIFEDRVWKVLNLNLPY